MNPLYYRDNKAIIAEKQKARLAARTPEQVEADRLYHQEYYRKSREKQGLPVDVRATQRQQALDDPLHKTCTKCRERKPLEAFGDRKKSKDGKQFQCLECKRTQWKDYAENRQDKAARKEYYEGYVAINRPKIAARMKDYDAMRTANGLRDYQTNPERNRRRSKEYYHEHVEDQRAYKAKHKERYRIQWKEYAEKNAEEIRAYQIAHRPQTNARVQAWAKAFPERNAAREQRRRARKLSLPDTWTGEQIAFMLEYWGHACAVCHNPKGFFWSLAHDHWIPVTSPECPGTIASNMIPLCHGEGGCNNSKGKSDPHAWLLKRFGAKKTAQIERRINNYFLEVSKRFPTT